MVGRLSVVDRFLPVWIALAMAAGLVLGRVIPGLGSALGAVSIHGTSLPIAIGLLLMMYPVLAKVRYREVGRITADRRMMTASLALNWIIGPAVMFALAWLLLPRPARLPHRGDPGRPGPLHRHGADLERPGLR